MSEGIDPGYSEALADKVHAMSQAETAPSADEMAQLAEKVAKLGQLHPQEAGVVAYYATTALKLPAGIREQLSAIRTAARQADPTGLTERVAAAMNSMSGNVGILQVDNRPPTSLPTPQIEHPLGQKVIGYRREMLIKNSPRRR